MKKETVLKTIEITNVAVFFCIQKRVIDDDDRVLVSENHRFSIPTEGEFEGSFAPVEPHITSLGFPTLNQSDKDCMKAALLVAKSLPSFVAQEGGM